MPRWTGFQYLIAHGWVRARHAALEFVFDARVWRRPRRLAIALAPAFGRLRGLGPVGHGVGDLGVRPRLHGGHHPARGPAVEELVFFAVVPVCALLTLESVRNVLSGRVALPSLATGEGGADAGLPGAGDRGGRRESSPWSRAVFRSGLFRQPAYWVAMAIVYVFMVPVDGWLTELSAPIVVYRDADTSGLRPVWDILAEEFLYAFALLTLVILMWDRAGRHEEADERRADRGRPAWRPALSSRT